MAHRIKRRASIAATLLCLAGLCTVAPAAATDWDSVAGWDVYEIDAARCVVGRVFAGGSTFGIIMKVDGEVRVFATGPGWQTRAGETVEAQIGLDERTRIAGPAVGIQQQHNRGFVTAASADFLTHFAAATQLTVRPRAGVPMDRLPLTGNAAGLAQGRRCVAALQEERRAAPAPLARSQAPSAAPRTVAAARPPLSRTAAAPQPRAAAVQAVVAQPAVARGTLAAWMGDADYPSAALRARQEGAVVVKLAIARTGDVAACDVVKTSGSAALDAETCRIFKRRARYKPALDAGGNPVDSIDHHTVRWQLPE